MLKMLQMQQQCSERFFANKTHIHTSGPAKSDKNVKFAALAFSRFVNRTATRITEKVVHIIFHCAMT